MPVAGNLLHSDIETSLVNNVQVTTDVESVSHAVVSNSLQPRRL